MATFYTHYGDVFAWLMVAGAVLLLAWGGGGAHARGRVVDGVDGALKGQ